MNAQEFQTWWEYHASLLPSVGLWMAQKGVEATLDSWFEVLAPIALGDALEASKAILAGEAEKVWPEETPAAVRMLAKQMAANERRAEESKHWRRDSFHCLDCRDVGWVIREDSKARPWGFACHCQKGDGRWAEKLKRIHLW